MCISPCLPNNEPTFLIMSTIKETVSLTDAFSPGCESDDAELLVLPVEGVPELCVGVFLLFDFLRDCFLFCFFFFSFDG